MPFLLSPCVLWIFTCIGFLSADSITSVSARLNSTVLLHCNFTPDLSLTPHVQWRIGSGVVFERQGGASYQGEGYEGRVDVPEDELLKGNCSLVLKNIRATDADIYNSKMAVKRTKRSLTDGWDFFQTIELRIDETQTPPGKPIPDIVTRPPRTKTPRSDKETSEEDPPRTNDAGMNSRNTLIILLVIVCVFIALLAIIAILIYRRRNINKPSDQSALKISVDDEHRVFVNT